MPRWNMQRHDRVWRVALLAAPLTVFGLFVVWPLLDSFYYSITDWNGFGNSYDFVGLSNFANIASDPLFLDATINTAIWIVCAILIPSFLGLCLALLLDTNVWGSRVFKTVFYLPICLSAIIVGQIWMWIYQPEWGLLNTVLSALIGKHMTFAWLARPRSALAAVIVAWSWQQTGLSMVIYLAGLTAIPKDLLEVCRMEGATGFQRNWHVVLPLLTPSTIVVVALAVINSLKGFDILYIMTGGGPFNSSNTLAMYMYKECFHKYLMGYGSAISVVLFLIALTVIGIYFRQLKKIDRIYG